MSSTQAATDEEQRKSDDDSVLLGLDFPKPTRSDVLAGVSVALVLIPQCIAYAAIAGMPPMVGLFASAFPLLVFAFFASSPYLQTGPVATTSLLTFAALTASKIPAGHAWVEAGTLLALIVGVIRLVFGACRLGWVAYLISDAVMIGFTAGAAILIMASQFPKCVGVQGDFFEALSGFATWSKASIALALATVSLMVLGKRIHRRFPGVLVAVVLGLVASAWITVPTVGKVPAALPTLVLSFPVPSIPILIFAFVIAFVGFAEPSAIARTFANEDNTKWNANREFFASGLANLAAAFSGAYPVGGSFSRSSVNRVSGAKTRWSGAITGLCVIAFLPFAWILSSLPIAVLGGIVLAAVYRLTKPRRMVRLWLRSPHQAALAWITFVATILTAPKIHYAVLLGVGLSIALHFARRLTIRTVGETDTDRELHVRPEGLLWYFTQNSLREQLDSVADSNPTKDLKIDLGELIAMDATTIDTIAQLAKRIHPRKVTFADSPWETGDDVRAAIDRVADGR